MRQAGVRSLVWYPGVLAAGLAGGLVSNAPTTLLFVLVGEALSYFLSLCFTALVAALCAVLAGNALAGDGRRVRLWSVVGVSEVAAILVALANTFVVTYPIIDGVSVTPVSLGQQMTFNTVAVSLVSGVTAWGLRRPPAAEAPEDARSAALLVVLALLLVASGVVIGGMSGPAA